MSLKPSGGGFLLDAWRTAGIVIESLLFGARVVESRRQGRRACRGEDGDVGAFRCLASGTSRGLGGRMEWARR